MDGHLPSDGRVTGGEQQEEEDALDMQQDLSLIQARAGDGSGESATEYETESNGTHMYATEDTGDASGRDFSGREDNGDHDGQHDDSTVDQGADDTPNERGEDPHEDEPETLIDADSGALEDADHAPPERQPEPRVIAFDDFAPADDVDVSDVDALNTDATAGNGIDTADHPYSANSAESDSATNAGAEEGNPGQGDSQPGESRDGGNSDSAGSAAARRPHTQQDGENGHAIVVRVPSSAAMSPSHADPDASVDSATTALSRGLNYIGTRLNNHPDVKQAIDRGEITHSFIEAMTPQRAEELYGEDVADRLRVPGLRINTLSTGDPVDFVMVYKPEKVDEEDLVDGVLGDSHGPNMAEVRRERKRLRFELNLMRKRLVLEREKSSKVVFVKVHCPFAVLCERAQTFQMKLPLKSATLQEKLQNKEVLAQKHRLRRVLEAVLPDKWVARLFFDQASRHDTNRASTAHFSVEHAHKFENFDNPSKFFSRAQRSVLARHILLNTKYAESDTKAGIDRLIDNGAYITAFPLHDASFDLPRDIDAKRGRVLCPPKEQAQSSKKITFDNERIDTYGLRAILLEAWGRFMCVFKPQPLGLVREYFGEKIAFYFAWLGFYTTWLLIPAVVGFLTLFYGLAEFQGREDSEQVCNSNVTMCAACDTCEQWQLNSSCIAIEATYIFDNEATIAFAFFMSLWATVFTEFWKRAQAELSFDWNMVDHDDFEPLRPQFRPTKMRKNLITDQEEPHYPPMRRLLKYLATGSVVLTACATVIIILLSTIVYRIAVYTAYVTQNPEQQDQASLIASGTAAVINLAVIILLSFFYRYLAVLLTNWENHKTTSKYEQHLTIKIFVFQFFNSFGSLFYIAFFQRQDIGVPGEYDTFFGYQADSCPAYGCLLELTIQLGVIMVGRQAFNNVLEIGLPLVSAWFTKRSAGLKELKHDNLLPWEEDYFLLTDYPRLGLFDDYLEMCLQYGFITLFVASFPLAPFFALFNNVLEVRVDSSKFIGLWRRPLAERAAGLGLWRQVLEFLTLASVVTNGLVISFTSNFVDKLVYRESRGSLQGFYFDITAESPYTGPKDIYTDCRYFGVRDEEGEYTKLFYEIVMGKLAFFIVFEHVVFLTKFLAQVLIKDEPNWVTIARKREVYQARAIIEGLSDTHYLNAMQSELTNRGQDAGPETSNEQKQQLQQDEANLRRRRQHLDESVV